MSSVMPMPESVVHISTATKLVLSPHSLRHVGQYVDDLDCRRILVIAGMRTSQTRMYKTVIQALGGRLAAEFNDVVAHSSVDSVNRGAALARRSKVDGLLVVGGGSAVDTAKGIAILLAEGGSIEDHATRYIPPDTLIQKPLSHKKLPILAIPTTASAAEVTPGLSIRTDEGHKLLFWDHKLAARCVILDPAGNDETPVGILATSAMNALAHCLEALYSKTRNPMTDALAAKAAELLARALPGLAGEMPAQARAGILFGAHLSGLAISNARTGIGHAVCHGLGSAGGLSHGDAHSVMLPHVLRFNMAQAQEPIRMFAAAIAQKDIDEPRSGDAAVQAVQNLQNRCGLPSRLRDLGLARDTLPLIAALTMKERGVMFNPRATTEADVLALLEVAW